jgi:hypothetical protein
MSILLILCSKLCWKGQSLSGAQVSTSSVRNDAGSPALMSRIVQVVHCESSPPRCEFVVSGISRTRHTTAGGRNHPLLTHIMNSSFVILRSIYVTYLWLVAVSLRDYSNSRPLVLMVPYDSSRRPSITYSYAYSYM